MTVGALVRRSWAIVRSAPLTCIWLIVLLVTTVIQHITTPAELTQLLGERSTNLHNLTTDPVRVLFTSLFWIDGAYWLPYAIAFGVFHIPAERWLGSVRWLAIGLSAHILATFVSEGLLGIAIRNGAADQSMVNVLDVGVSYSLAGIVGVVTYHVAFPWRWFYIAGLLAVYALPLVVALNFTAVGHFTSVLVGLACYPLARRRGEPWNPWNMVRTCRSGVDRIWTTHPISRHRNS